MTRALPLAVLLLIGSVTLSAWADEPSKPLVVLLRPDPPDPALGQMFVRMAGELGTAGFGVTIVAKAADEDPRAAIERASKTLAPAAVIGVFGDPLVGMELWVTDRSSGRNLVRHLNATGESGARASEILAVRAAEQLSAGLVELNLLPKPVEATRPAKVTPVPPSEPPPRVERHAEPSRFQAELGLGSLFSFEGASPTLTPVARLGWAVLPAWQVRLTGAGLGSKSRISSCRRHGEVLARSVAGRGRVRPQQAR